MLEVEAMRWEGDALLLLDQRLLPHEVFWVRCETYGQVAEAIRTLTVRGAPAIGSAAAFGMALAAKQALREGQSVLEALERARQILAASRPTARNLFWALERMGRVVNGHAALPPDELAARLEAEAVAIYREDYEANLRLSQHGAELLQKDVKVLTHCNTGALAAAWGTALGIVKVAHRQGKVKTVWVDETRPVLQGARLTTWELLTEGIPFRLIADGAAPYLMSRGMVDAVIVGADRITCDGSVANKIGTYGLALSAKHHGIPFYVAAPCSTIDPNLPDGSSIPIEERSEEEVLSWHGVRVAPEGAKAFNPAFDVTPATLVTAIVTERGVLRPPYEQSIAEALKAG